MTLKESHLHEILSSSRRRPCDEVLAHSVASVDVTALGGSGAGDIVLGNGVAKSPQACQEESAAAGEVPVA